jgi:hypothetical protein
VVIHITDTGTGMTPEVKQRLFDPFFTTKGKAGTGMGLAVSFGIIRRHEGSIEVDSEPGRGTTFKISLPKVLPEVPQPEGIRTPTATTTNAEDKVRVMVVDDETHVREVLIEALEAESCEVISAQSGEIALALYDQYEGKFDALFTDIGMPDMSGWADAISLETKNEVKADWVVAKPFDIDKICKLAQEITQRKSGVKA